MRRFVQADAARLSAQGVHVCFNHASGMSACVVVSWYCK